MEEPKAKKEWTAPEGTVIVHYIWKDGGKHAVYADPKKPGSEFIDPTVLKEVKPVDPKVAQFIHK